MQSNNHANTTIMSMNGNNGGYNQGMYPPGTYPPNYGPTYANTNTMPTGPSPQGFGGPNPHYMA